MGYSPWGHKESDMTERLSTRAYRVPFLLNNLTVADFSSNLMSHRLIKRATSGEKKLWNQIFTEALKTWQSWAMELIQKLGVASILGN